jgi:hypothetical protein
MRSIASLKPHSGDAALQSYLCPIDRGAESGKSRTAAFGECWASEKVLVAGLV